MMKILKLLMLSVIVLMVSCTSKKKYNQALIVEHPVEALKKDYQILKTSLLEAHPGIYWYIDSIVLAQKFDSVENLLNKPLTSLAFYRYVAPLITEIKCGHTRLVYPNKKYTLAEKQALKAKGVHPFNQFKIALDEDKVFIKSVRDSSSHPLKPKMQILSIDAYPVNTIIKKANQLFSSDGYNKTLQPYIIENNFGYYYQLNFKKSDSILLKIKQDTLIKDVNLGFKKIKSSSKKIDKKLVYLGKDADGKPILDLKIDTLTKVAILKVGSFSFEQANFSKFYRQSFKKLKEQKINNLILDLRGNSGGRLSACNKLFRYLYDQPAIFNQRVEVKERYISTRKYFQNSWFYNFPFPHLTIKKDSLGYYTPLRTHKYLEPKNNVYQQNLFVLINGLSYSATSLLAANLQGVKRGFFIGEETGGAYNKCTAGIIPYVNLPNTKVKLRLPLKVMKPNTSQSIVGRGVFPHHEVHSNLLDELEGKDKQLEKALQLIKSR
ncbi:S41 family peptidase [Pedobacter glucosidilyticus]|uniref:S41 family peptidase n=1 Tax=Pedobacter glucosidilyticus TaxID=1122941 RepID=UPI0026F36340|nr:S41 family peptidase [Pedobacter glucosidilyticus]